MEDCFMWKDSRAPSGQEPSLSITASLICLLESDSVTREAVFVGTPCDLCNFKTQFFFFLNAYFEFSQQAGLRFLQRVTANYSRSCTRFPIDWKQLFPHRGSCRVCTYSAQKKDFPKGFLGSWKRKLKVEFCFFSWYCLSWHGCFSFFLFFFFCRKWLRLLFQHIPKNKTYFKHESLKAFKTNLN